MGQEFRVNSYQSNWQHDPDVIVLADGSFWVVWESYFNDYDDGPELTYIAGQRFDASGARIGNETVLDAVNGANSSSARATALADGGFVLVWTYDDYDPILSLKTKVYAQVLNADGSARSAAVQVDSVASNDAILPEAIALANGGFMVQFGVTRSTTLFDQIYRQQFTANGTKVGGNQLVNTKVGDFDQIYVRSAQLENGTTISIWNSEASYVIPGSNLDSNEIRGTIYRADGTVLRGDFSLAENIGTVGAHNGSGYDVARLANGGFVISHLAYDHDLGLDTEDTSYYMVMRFYSATGTAVSGPKTVFASDDLSNGTRIVQLDNGQILVVWSQDPIQSQISDDVYGRLFSSSGKALTGAFEISNDYGDSYAEQAAPEIAALQGGGFVVTYESESIDNDNEGIAARVYGRGTGASETLAVDVSGMMAGLGGNDRISGNAFANGLSGGAGNDTLTGNSGADSLEGGSGYDRLVGGSGSDLIYGGDGLDDLAGGLGKDTLGGGNGADVLNGGAGVDRLTGSAGADRFVFGHAAGNTHRDVITDFRAVDSIHLDRDHFAAGPSGTIASHRFKVLGSSAVDSTDRVLYDRASGILYYDADGSGSGARRAIAVLDNHASLTYADIILF